VSGPGNLPWDSTEVFGPPATVTPVDARDEAFELVAQLPFEPLTLVEELATCEADELLLQLYAFAVCKLVLGIAIIAIIAKATPNARII
jgi:hypothetical protein